MLRIRLELHRNEALVFFDWLAKFNDIDHPDMDEAERRVLFALESSLEKLLTEPLERDYDMCVAEAKAYVIGEKEESK